MVIRVRADALQLGARLDGDRLAKARGDGALGLDDFDDGGGFADANHAAGLAGILDHVTGAEVRAARAFFGGTGL